MHREAAAGNAAQQAIIDRGRGRIYDLDAAYLEAHADEIAAGPDDAPMDLGLEGRVVLVTGAASGIGRATAGQLAGMGARVLASDIDADAGAAAAAALRDAGGDARFVAGDIADEDTAARARRGGGRRLRAARRRGELRRASAAATRARTSTRSRRGTGSSP